MMYVNYESHFHFHPHFPFYVFIIICVPRGFNIKDDTSSSSFVVKRKNRIFFSFSSNAFDTFTSPSSINLSQRRLHVTAFYQQTMEQINTQPPSLHRPRVSPPPPPLHLSSISILESGDCLFIALLLGSISSTYARGFFSRTR